MKRTLAIAGALVALQAALIGVYLLVERDDGPASAARLADFEVESADGRVRTLRDLADGPVVLHFWATWCAPCRRELPGLLRYAEETDLPVLAISLDTDWEAIRGFLDGPPPSAVVRADSSAAAARFGVTGLPTTVVFDSAGDVRLRILGTRDWSSEAVRDEVERAATGR